jgi:hypothetical protein
MNETQHDVRSEVVPRIQWNANSGYCGETSFICAGLNFGQYCSQWTARTLASDRPQYQADSQLLLGTGLDVRAAMEMRLNASEFPGGSNVSTPEFLVWIKSHLIQGHVPVIGVFNNVNILGESLPGDSQYDHIVPIVGWESESPMEDGGVHYYGSDIITLSDNGLYGPIGEPPHYPLLFRYDVNDFQGDRQQANNPDGAVYMLSNSPPNYGIAIEGVQDSDGACLPVRLSCDIDHERNPPAMASSPSAPPALAQPPLCDQPPKPLPLRLTATVDLSGQSGPCNLYRYNDFAQVPVQNFNAAAGDAVQHWHIPAGYGPTFVVEHAAMSDETVVFRAVPASAS